MIYNVQINGLLHTNDYSLYLIINLCKKCTISLAKILYIFVDYIAKKYVKGNMVGILHTKIEKKLGSMGNNE